MRMSFSIKVRQRMDETRVKINENRKQRFLSKTKCLLDLEMMKSSLRHQAISKMRIETRFLIQVILIGVDYKTMIIRKIQFKTSFLREKHLFEENEISLFQQYQRILSNEFNENLNIADQTSSLRCSEISKKRLLQELILLL